MATFKDSHIPDAIKALQAAAREGRIDNADACAWLSDIRDLCRSHLSDEAWVLQDLMWRWSDTINQEERTREALLKTAALACLYRDLLDASTVVLEKTYMADALPTIEALHVYAGDDPAVLKEVATYEKNLRTMGKAPQREYPVSAVLGLQSVAPSTAPPARLLPSLFILLSSSSS